MIYGVHQFRHLHATIFEIIIWCYFNCSCRLTVDAFGRKAEPAHDDSLAGYYWKARSRLLWCDDARQRTKTYTPKYNLHDTSCIMQPNFFNISLNFPPQKYSTTCSKEEREKCVNKNVHRNANAIDMHICIWLCVCGECTERTSVHDCMRTFAISARTEKNTTTN